MEPKFRAKWSTSVCISGKLKSCWVICLILLNTQYDISTATENSKMTEGDNPSEVHGWPGHMQPLGKDIPQKNVDVYKKFPPVDVFFSDFVLPSIPVRMKKAAGRLSGIFDVQGMASTPQAFTTYVDVLKTGEPNLKKMSVRRFLSNYKSENLFLDIPIPTIIKSQIPLPRCLQCKAIADKLLSTNLLFLPEKRAQPLRSNANHFIECQLRGNSEIRFINFATFPKRKEILDLKDGFESGVDVEAVDHHKYPALSEVKEYYVATLEEGDCLYVPAMWLYQWTSLGESLFVRVVWRSKLIVPSVASCGNMSETDLVILNFQEDPPLDIMSLLTFNDLYHFIQNYFLQGSKHKLTEEVFEESLKKDEKYTKDIEWNDECQSIVQEMFQQLDVNHDGVLSIEDLDNLSFEDMNHLAGIVDDRLADFADIEEDQKAEKQGSLFDVSKKLSANYEDLQSTFENSFGELIKEIEDLEKQSKNEEKSDKVEKIKLAQEKKPLSSDSKDVEDRQVEDDNDEMKKIKMMEKMIMESISGKTEKGDESKTDDKSEKNEDEGDHNSQKDSKIKKDEL